MKTLLFLCLILSSTVAADNVDVRARFSRGWVAAWSLFFPEGRRETYLAATGKEAYEKDLRKVFERDRDLAHLVCANRRLSPVMTQPSDPPATKELRPILESVCNDFPPPPELLVAIRNERRVPPDSPRQTVARRRRWNQEEMRRLSATVYLPPPAEPEEWLQGIAGRDYSGDLLAAFNADPTLAAAACEAAEMKSLRPLHPNLVPLLPQLKKICGEFPVEKMVTAYRALHRDQVFAWLQGLVNTYIREVEAIPIEPRRAEVEKIAADIKRQPGSVARFQLALKTIVLDPEGDWGPALTLAYAPEAGYTSKPGAEPGQVREFVEQLYESRSKGADALRWKRGRRAFLLMTSQFESARDLAREIVQSSDSADGHGRDQIYLAVLERITGNSAPYEQLMAACPDPDAAYIQKAGKPATRQRYCEDEVAAIASRAMARFGDAAPATLRAMFVETNRVSPVPFATRVTSAAPVSPREEATQRYSARFNNEIERARRLSEETRRHEADALLASLPGYVYGSDGIETGLRIIALNPADDRGAFVAAQALQTLPDDASAHAAKTFLAEMYRREMAGGEEKDDWKRGWRGYLVYSGAWTEALQISRELMMQTSNPEDTPRDRVFVALLERINGNPAPLDALLANCPDAAPSYVRRYGPNAAAGYCRRIVWSISFRALLVLGESSPPALQQAIIDTMNRDDWTNVLATIGRLQEANVDFAEQKWQELLDAPSHEVPDEIRWEALVRLSRIAQARKEHRKAIELIDRYLAATDTVDPGFTAQAWRDLANEPENSLMGGFRTRSTRNDMLAAKIANAIDAADFALAQLTVETLLTWTAETGDASSVRWYLERIADAMIRSGKVDEPLRILGYLSVNPLDSASRSRVEEMLKRLARAAGPDAKLAPASAPWESRARPDLRNRPASPRPPAPVT